MRSTANRSITSIYVVHQSYTHWLLYQLSADFKFIYISKFACFYLTRSAVEIWKQHFEISVKKYFPKNLFILFYKREKEFEYYWW